MHSDTPLGITMHLKALDRQAAPMLHPLRIRWLGASPVTALRAAMNMLLRHLHSVGILGRAASQG
jgi:hypothetical protein